MAGRNGVTFPMEPTFAHSLTVGEAPIISQRSRLKIPEMAVEEVRNATKEIKRKLPPEALLEKAKLLAENRPFVAWDGEGITLAPGTAQHYVLLANSNGGRIMDEDGTFGLSTNDCLSFLMSEKKKYPDAIHIGFAFNYDINMILADLSRGQLERIKRNGVCRHGRYRIEWRPGKWFRVSHKGCTITIFDIFGFFQSSFVVACEKFLGKEDSELVAIRLGKAARESFTMADLRRFILPYCEGELRLMVRLAESLREDFLSAGIAVSSWHGPGAVANSVFKSKRIKEYKGEIPDRVNLASRFAYAGGRFELFQCGAYPAEVWEYDINSAYPFAISQLPGLSQGSWEYTTEFEPESFGVWRVRRQASGHPMLGPQPFFLREKHGGMSYPANVEGWYWTPEAGIEPESVIGGYVFRPDDESRPFAFVREMYDQRREWKREGNSAERALKLALNSLYGKMAQRVGGDKGRIPTWHQLEWAGYVTSFTRRMIWDAIQLAGNQVIAVETDAVFSMTELPLSCGEQLGEWSLTKFDNIIYLQSGLYYANVSKDGRSVGISKYRGLDKDRETGQPQGLPARKVLDHLRHFGNAGRDIPPLFGNTTRFIGLGIGLHSRELVWRSWHTDKRAIHYGGSGKRLHLAKFCPECIEGKNHIDQLHHTIVSSSGGISYPHTLPWLATPEIGEDEFFQALEDFDRWN